MEDCRHERGASGVEPQVWAAVGIAKPLRSPKLNGGMSDFTYQSEGGEVGKSTRDLNWRRPSRFRARGAST